MDPMEAIRQTFFQECEEQLAELENGLMAIDGGNTDTDIINAVFRSVHSIKGGAGAFGLEDLVRFAHVFETTLDEVRAGRLLICSDLLAVMLRAADGLADLVRAARDGGTADTAKCGLLAAELRKFGTAEHHDGDDEAAAESDDGMDGLGFQPVQVLADDLPPETPPTSIWHIRFKPFPAMYDKANETGLLLRELKRLGGLEVRLDVAALPLLQEIEADGAYLAWDLQLDTDAHEEAIREIFDFVAEDCELEINLATPPGNSDGSADLDLDLDTLLQKVRDQFEEARPDTPVALTPSSHPAPAAGSDKQDPHLASAGKKSAEGNAATPASATIRVDLDRVDHLIDVVGELVINQAMLAQRVTEAGLARASNVITALDELEQLTRDIQDSVMAIRAQPVSSVFQRMPRLVREVAALTGKSVRLVTDGEATEVDKTVIERLADPLTHMIRNAIDHGLESTERRIAVGKPAEGVVRLSALHRSGRIVIEVSDDGSGIDRTRVKEIAIERGLIPPDVVLSDEEADNLIFLPGFSTAATISDVSGRGVGMDVVRRSVQQLGGRISIVSRPGLGCTFTLSLPLTLAVLDGMVVTAGNQPLVIPLTAIIETMLPKTSDVHELVGDARVIAIRERFLPFVDVGQALGYREQSIGSGAGVALLVENESGDRAALQVDAIQGQRQVVIKSLEANCGRVRGIAAATVLGDGRVALILDVDAIFSVVRADSARAEPSYALAG